MLVNREIHYHTHLIGKCFRSLHAHIAKSKNTLMVTNVLYSNEIAEDKCPRGH